MGEDAEFAPEESGQDSEVVELPGEQQETESGSAESTPTDRESETEKDNPAWKDILDPVPQEFHGHLKGHLSRMNQYAQELEQKYSGYKPFAENNVTREQLEMGLQLIQTFNQNPRGVWEYLTKTYNFTPEQQQQLQDAVTDSQSQEVDGEQPDIFKDPRVQQLANQSAFAMQQVQQMQQAQLEAQMSAQVDNEINALSQHPQYKNIPRDIVIRQALGMAAAEQNRTGREVPADLMAAAKYLWDSGAYQSRNRPIPPNLTNGNRGVPSDGDPLEGIGSKSRRERTALFARLAAEANQ